MSAIFLCFGSSTECPCCGGSIYAEEGKFVNGKWRKKRNGFKGPFHALDGKKFCSEECAEDFAEMVGKYGGNRKPDWCPECGFDNHEHSEECSKTMAPV